MPSRLLLFISSFLAFSGCDSLPENPPAPVESVDLERYMGLWYEIARLPVPFQKDGELATAEYRLNEEGTIDLVNTAISPEGSTRSVTGTAVPVAPGTLSSRRLRRGGCRAEALRKRRRELVGLSAFAEWNAYH